MYAGSVRRSALFRDAQAGCESRRSRHFVVLMQHARICRGIGKAGRVLDRRPTSSARLPSVGLQASCSGTRMAGGKVAGNVVTVETVTPNAWESITLAAITEASRPEESPGISSFQVRALQDRHGAAPGDWFQFGSSGVVRGGGLEPPWLLTASTSS
jgi:hypothetical protein